MSDPADDRRVLAVLRDFHCEHTASKSRVLALVAHPDGPPSLKAVLTCRDAEQAQRSAEILRAVLACGSPIAPDLTAQADALALEMPAAVGASLRQALDSARTGGWLVEEDQLSWEQSEEAEAALNVWRTRPEEYNLSRLTNPVVRVVGFAEYLVTDPVALFNSATSMGWRPSGSLQGGIGDPVHFMEATALLAAPSVDLPGAQVIGAGSSLHVLDAQRGDELADWSPDGFQVGFGPGWRLERDPSGPGMTTEEWERLVPLPDYAGLFQLQRAADAAWQFTPRTAYVLDGLLSTIADEGAQAARDFGEEVVREEHRDHMTVFTDLPEATWDQGYAWRRDFARAADDLSEDIAAGRIPAPRCVAERVALDLALDGARAHAKGTAGITPSYDRLPRHRDDSWDLVEDALLHPDDEDVEGLPPLWDTAADQWFVPLPGSEPRNPDRGYPEQWSSSEQQ
ncbi:hypothetical protein [Streptacidiphilus sp. EB103A]|uniref:hypothetical protein n=1 Tax=Streptacidiphilus sp. EB103A TaxID=3156275 RepID=UPI0035152483